MNKFPRPSVMTFPPSKMNGGDSHVNDGAASSSLDDDDDDDDDDVVVVVVADTNDKDDATADTRHGTASSANRVAYPR